MTRANNFSAAVRDALCERAGNMCSFPGCDLSTIGPSEESATAVSNTGMACHIVSASNELPARRRDPNFPDASCRSLSNGIWMCYTHGKLIDTDERRFTIAVLRHWKLVAEQKATARQSLPGRNVLPLVHGIGLGAHDIALPDPDEENEQIALALVDAGVGMAWGREAELAARDVLIEAARNARHHGKASKLRIEITSRGISLIDNGNCFDPLILASTRTLRGGSTAIGHFVDTYGSVAIAWRRADEENLLTLCLPWSADDLSALAPCCVVLDRKKLRQPLDIRGRESCGVLFVVLAPYTSISDAALVAAHLSPWTAAGRPIIFIIDDVSERTAAALQRIPNAKVQRLSAPTK